MTLIQFTLKNLSRRPTRTVLTVLGIGVGIGAVVALMGMARGLNQSWNDAYKARGTDLVVRNAGGGLMAQPFDEKSIEGIRKVPGVAAAANLLTEFLSVEQASGLVVSGREWGSFLWDSLNIVEGRKPRDAAEKAVVLGTLAAESLHKKPGDTLTLEVEEFTVVGIADGKAVVENGSIFLALPHLQKIMQKENKVNFVNVGSSNDVFKALVGGAIDAGVAPIEFRDTAAKFKLYPLVDGEFWRDLPLYANQAMYASDKGIVDRRAGIVGVLAAYADMFRWICRPENKPAFFRYYKQAISNASDDEANFLQAFLSQPGGLATELVLNEAQLRYIQDLNIELGAQKAILPFEQCADMSLAREAVALIRA